MNKSLINRFLFFMTTLALSGCTIYPLNMSEAEWQRLTTAQQLEARKQQAEIDQVERQRQAEMARLAAEREQREEALRRERLRNAAPGEVVQCVLQNAEGYLGGKWRKTAPTGFTVVRGFSEHVVIAQEGEYGRTVAIEAHFEGARVELCRPDRRECASLAATQNQLRRGVTRTIQLNRTIRGELYCDTPLPYRNHYPARH